ncbi:MAG: NCS2 family permease [Candidatus Schekmanbacteria bacterium]|nr:NCS2 family permease [Candidatus Schekmanbacteria bacterium]
MFKLGASGTTVGQEIRAGLTTFMTMAYIIVVNPAILGAAALGDRGIPKDASLVATVLAAAFGTILMGLYANRPFAVAPYMGENAFVAFTVVLGLGYTWQSALGAIFIGGLLFVALTLVRLRTWLAAAIPRSLKSSFAAGIGLFLTFIGLNDTGIVRLGVDKAPVKVGDLTTATALLAVFAFVLMVSLLVKRVSGAIMIGILATTGLGFLLGLQPLPARWAALPPSLAPTFLALDIRSALTWGFFPVILTVFVMDFVDTMGTLIGLSARAGLLDERGNLPEIEKPMLVDALATVFGAAVGTTTTGAYIESAAGIAEGGRTGLASIVTGVAFLGALFFTDVLTAIPAFAYGPALIVVGIMMLRPVTEIDFDDYTELVPAFATMTLMSFSYNIGIGMTAGFVLFAFVKLVAGRTREVHPGMWLLAGLSLLFYVFFPY